MAAKNLFAVSWNTQIFSFKFNFNFSHFILFYFSYIDCIPKAQCKPVQNYTNLEVGFKAVVDNTGCCPTSKLICDKLLCPPKPSACTEAFYQLKQTKAANDKICCDIYECRKSQYRENNWKFCLSYLPRVIMLKFICMTGIFLLFLAQISL
jgi:hypothetical protein